MWHFKSQLNLLHTPFSNRNHVVRSAESTPAFSALYRRIRVYSDAIIVKLFSVNL